MHENREISNSLFVELFSDNKRFLELYNALTDQHLKFEETTIKDSVIQNTIYRSLKNDVCKVINGKVVVLVEHQSTVNENMPLRCLLYIARVYEMLVPKHERYYKARREIPKPEFFVLYTGIDDIEEYKELRLSDAFVTEERKTPDSDHEIQLELKVPFVNVRPGKNLKILENCNTLKEYSELIEKIHNLLQETDNREIVYKKSIKWGLAEGILKGYLEKAVSEIINMLIAEYSYEEDVAAQREEAFELGAKKTAIETATNLLKMNVGTQEQIAQATGLSLEKVQKLAEGLGK